jgi:WD40 repeat protein
MKNPKRNQLLSAFLILALLPLTGCNLPSASEVMPAPSAAATSTAPAAAATGSATQAPVETAAPAGAQETLAAMAAGTGFVRLSSLPKGQYLIIHTAATDTQSHLGILTPDGQFLGSLSEVIGTLSHQRAYIAPDPFSYNDPVLYALETGDFVPVSIELRTCGRASWSPDDEKIALDCESPELERPIDVYVLTLKSGELTRLTHCTTEAFICASPSWSPDGRWIAYIRALGGAGTSDQLGLHLIDTSCFADSATCDGKSTGPYPIEGMAWSPDGGQIAGFTNDGTIRIYAVSQTALTERQVYQARERIDSISWSEDGRFIAYGAENQIYLLSLETNETRSLYSATYAAVMGWIEIR